MLLFNTIDLPTAEFSYNSTKHATTGKSPFNTSAKRHVSVMSRPALQAVGRSSDNLTTQWRHFIRWGAIHQGREPYIGRKAVHQMESCMLDGELHVRWKTAHQTESCTSDRELYIRWELHIRWKATHQMKS